MFQNVPKVTVSRGPVDFAPYSANIATSHLWQQLTSSTLGLWLTGLIRLFKPAVCESHNQFAPHWPG